MWWNLLKMKEDTCGFVVALCMCLDRCTHMLRPGLLLRKYHCDISSSENFGSASGVCYFRVYIREWMNVASGLLAYTYWTSLPICWTSPSHGNRSTRTQATRPGQLAPHTQDNSHPTMSQLAPDSMLRAYCFRKTMLIVWYMPLCVY